MTPKESMESRQLRMLKAETFHFDSGGDNRRNLEAAADLKKRGLITIRENGYDQFSVFQCEITDAGRDFRAWKP